MENKVVDNAGQVGYNKGNDVNEFVVKMDEQRPIHDTECKHETLVADPTDTIGTAVYHGCANPNCHRGWYIQPMQ